MKTLGLEGRDVCADSDDENLPVHVSDDENRPVHVSDDDGGTFNLFISFCFVFLFLFYYTYAG